MVAATVSSFSISPVKWYLLQITPSFQLLAFVTHYYVWRRFLLLEIEKVPFFRWSHSIPIIFLIE